MAGLQIAHGKAGTSLFRNVLLERCPGCGSLIGRRLARIAHPVATGKTFQLPPKLLEGSQQSGLSAGRVLARMLSELPPLSNFVFGMRGHIMCLWPGGYSFQILSQGGDCILVSSLTCPGRT